MPKEVGKLAHRYGKALFRSVTDELGRGGRPSPAQQAAAKLSSFAELWQREREVSGTILNPMFDRGDRLRALLRLAAQDSLPDVLLRGLSVVFENDRIAALPEIARAFSDIADRDAGVVGVAVTVARDVEQYEVQQIEARLRQQIDGDLRFEWKVNPELIGGMVVRYQGKVVDGSLSSRLDLIESKLKG